MQLVIENGYVSAEIAAHYAVKLARYVDPDDDTPRLERLDLLRYAELWALLAAVLAVTGPVTLSPEDG